MFNNESFSKPQLNLNTFGFDLMEITQKWILKIFFDASYIKNKQYENGL